MSVVKSNPPRHDVKCHAGKCYLVGAGPGPIDLLTMKAVRLIQAADVIVYDDLGAQEAVATYARASCEKVYVGKRGGELSIKQVEIDKILVSLTQQGKQVVRLKGGCPSVFSRVASELRALEEAHLEWELVPGVSSVLAAPLLAGFPLTDVQLGSAFAVVTGHDVSGVQWGAFTPTSTPSLVIIMGGRNLALICAEMQGVGAWPATTPVAVIKSAANPDMRVWLSTLGTVVADTLGERLSPCVIVVGGVVASAVARPSQFKDLNPE
ncbi:MAG: hypothetical protein WDW38_003127 [Sanguina aurantia]